MRTEAGVAVTGYDGRGSVEVGTAVWPQGIAVDSTAGRAFVSLPGNATAAVIGPSV